MASPTHSDTFSNLTNAACNLEVDRKQDVSFSINAVLHGL